MGQYKLELEPEALDKLAEFADGDARRALNFLEIASDLAQNSVLNCEIVERVISGGSLKRFDKAGEAFYDQISACINLSEDRHPMLLYIGCQND